VSMITYCLY